jgi:hypothetical protein
MGPKKRERDLILGVVSGEYSWNRVVTYVPQVIAIVVMWVVCEMCRSWWDLTRFKSKPWAWAE